MRTTHLLSGSLAILLLVASPASADDCGCGHDQGERNTQSAEAVGVLAVVGAAAITSPLWLGDGRPYLEADASSVMGGRFKPAEEFPTLDDKQSVKGWGGLLSAGVSRLPANREAAIGVRGEVTGWHNTFEMRNPHPAPGPQDFNASVLALGAHVDARPDGLPVVFSLGGRLGGAYLSSHDASDHAWAWDVEAVAGVGVELNPHLMLVGDVRGVLLLPGNNNFTSGNGHAVLVDVGVRYTF
jgi:hypothetical protein